MHALVNPSAPLPFFAAFKRSTQLVTFLKTTIFVMLAFLLPLSALGQANYVYVNNQTAANSVVAYSVSPAGVLTNVPGSPFSTGGAGSTVVCYGLDRMIVTQNLLYVANTGDMTITGFTINPANGALTRIGSPVPSGLTQDACQGMSIAATPDGHFLMASSNGLIQTFAIGANGALTHSTSTASCCTPNAGMKISANGHFLAVANENNVSTFTVNPDGSLTSVLGSPFPKTGAGLVTGLDFSACSSNRLYGGEATGTPALADAWSVDATGALTPITGSPFQSNGNDSNVVLLSPNNVFLFESNQFTTSVSSFSMNADGSLGLIGRFGGVGTVHSPVGMATDPSGTFLYVADDNAGMALYRINANGSLTSIKDQLINLPAEIQSVAAYPSRSCASADLAISMTASSTTVSANNNVTYTITVTNNGPDPALFSVADNLPSTVGFVSCAATGGGVCVGTLGNRLVSFPALASGASATITLVARAGSTITNGTIITNTAVINNSSAIDPDTTNNSASTNVTASQPAPSTLTAAPATGPFGGSAVLSATLKKTSDNSPAVGETINFFINRNAVGTALTNASGVATLTAPLGTITPGTYAGAIIATFSGDNNFAASSGSATLTVTRPVLTVTANNLARVYGDPNPALTYTITGFVNGDTQTVVAGSASCTTTAAAASATGAYPITCTQGTLAAANYTFTFVPGSLTVNAAPLTVSVNNASRSYGTANPAFSGTITGIKNGDNITATYSTTATPASPVGTYPITAALADPNGKLPNYTVTISNGTLTIGAAVLTATADSATRAYGDPNPVFTGTLTGVQAGDNITASYVSAATPASSAGTYTITPVLSDPGNKLANYTVVLNNGTLTVGQAALTVTAANASRFYGDPNPAFTGTITGVKNGDNITATYSSVATATSAPGTYPIVPALVDPDGKLANYTVVINNGTLTVNAAPLTVTAANVTRLYGDPNPAFTGTITGLKNGDNITATYASTADATSAVGTYSIVPTLVDPASKLANYSVTVTNGTLTVAAAPLNVTAANATRLYGDPNPAFTGTITGLKNGDTITATYASAADPTSPVGTYPIVPTLVDPANKLGNYALTINNGILTVAQAPLTVTAASASRAFGDPNPAFTGTITGIKNGDNITATFASAADANSPVGTYPITPTLVDPTGKLGNYSVTVNNGTLTITASVLTVTAASTSRFYGDPNPVFTGTITGLKNGDNITATYASVADVTSAPGTYAIVATLVDPNGKLPNYTVVVNNGILTVNAAPLSVTAANAARLYGDPNSAFTGTITGLKNGDNIAAIYSSIADPTSPVGFYAIIPTLVDPNGKLSNYAVTITNGSLSVDPAPLVVTTIDAGRFYGDSNPAFTGSIVGLKNGDSITATFASIADPTSPVGNYAIVPSLVDPNSRLSNYTVTLNNGTLTVTPAPLSMVAADATRQVGTDNPVFTGTIAGIKNGDNITATFDSAATIDSPEGTYPIVPAVVDPDGKLANYAVSIVNGTLTITP